MNLYLLNAFRWVKHHAVAWSILFASYSVAASVVVQVILQELIGTQLRFLTVWALTAGVVAIPGLLERLPVPGAVGGRWSHLLGGAAHRIVGPLGVLYVSHELRRPATWLVVGMTAVAGAAVLGMSPAAWLLICQVSAQRAFFSISAWRRFAAFYRPGSGAAEVMRAFAVAQTVQVFAVGVLIALLATFLSPAAIGSGVPAVAGERILRFMAAMLGAAWASAAVVMEGDSGRPWLVNFVGLAAGFIGAVGGWASPFALFVIVYFMGQMSMVVAGRLKSVENPDEDIVIS